MNLLVFFLTIFLCGSGTGAMLLLRPRRSPRGLHAPLLRARSKISAPLPPPHGNVSRAMSAFALVLVSGMPLSGRACTRRAALAGCCFAVSGGGPQWAPAVAAGSTSSADATAERWLGGPAAGLFPDCSVACVSSQDDRPAVWDNPWVAEDEPNVAMKRLRRVVEQKLGGRVVLDDGLYLTAEFTSRGPLGGEVVDDAEWYFAPNDVLVQFRAARRGDSPDFGANRARMEKARIALGWSKVEVLRNRRRALVVVESPFDSFGPATYDRDEYGFTNRDIVPVNLAVSRITLLRVCAFFFFAKRWCSLASSPACAAGPLRAAAAHLPVCNPPILLPAGRGQPARDVWRPRPGSGTVAQAVC